MRRDCGGHAGAAEMPWLPLKEPGPGDRCAGHLVQFGTLALFNHGMAG